MNGATATLIATGPNGDDAAQQLARSLKTVVQWSRREGTYNDLFLSKHTIKFHDSDLPCDIESLVEAEILKVIEEPRSLKSNVMVHVDPHLQLTKELDDVDGVFLATDWPDTPPVDHGPALFDGREMVFPLHYESLVVVVELRKLLVAGINFEDGLDLFAGSGVIGIYAQKCGVNAITFCDMIPRSVAFSKLNSYMSGLRQASFVVSDCFRNIPSRSRFDLILANPPFEPVLEEDKPRYFYHSYGGPSGQELMNRFLTEMPEFLADDGWAISVDFLPSDSTGIGIDKHRRQMLTLHPQIARGGVAVRCYDQVPYWDFWLRYDVLGLDKRRKLRTQVVVDDPIGTSKTLVLATVTVHKQREQMSALSRKRHNTLEVSYEDEPPPVPWWNPIDWPLPCGIGSDRQSVELWFAAWRRHEYEMRSDRGALYAEAMAFSPTEGIEHVDFAEWLFTEQESATKQPLENALRSTALDIRFLSIGSVQLPEKVSLFLLPRGSGDNDPCVLIRPPVLPVRIGKSRPDAVTSSSDIPVEKVTFSDVTYQIAQLGRQRTSLAFFFTICNPIEHVQSLLEVPYYEYKGPGIAFVGKHMLVWNGRQYEPPHYDEMPFDAGAALHGAETEVQRYLVIIELPESGIEALERLEGLTEVGWQNTVSEQLFDFMRDQLTLLAIPLVLMQEAALQAELKQKVAERERLMAYTAHTVFAPANDALGLLDEIHRRTGHTDEALVLARSRVALLERNARLMVELWRADMADVRLEDVVVVDELLRPIVSDTLLIRKLTELPLIPIAFCPSSTPCRVRTHQGILGVVVTTLLQNAVDHIDSTLQRGSQADTTCDIQLSIEKVNERVRIRFANGGSSVSEDIVRRLNEEQPSGSTEQWGVSLKGSKHFGVGSRKVKALVRLLDGQIEYQLVDNRFCVVITLPRRSGDKGGVT